MGAGDLTGTLAPGVCAVVVTFNPPESLAAHLQALRPQCDALLVVDNGSDNAQGIAEATRAAGGEILLHAANLGVAAALNAGVRWATARGAPWIATFDQDTHCPPGAIPALLAAASKHPQFERAAVVCFAHEDRALGHDYHHRLDILHEDPDWRLLRTTITSGALVRLPVLRELGAFEERLFIDGVDHEAYLRLRRHGWLLLESRRHVLQHSIGDAKLHRVLGLGIATWQHSPVRRYYITRNQLEIARRNLFFDPVWSVKALWQMLAGNVATLVFEDGRGAKLRAMARGALHFLLRRFGPVR